MDLNFLSKANRFTGSLKTTLTIVDYFSKVAVVHMGFHNEKETT